MSTKISVYNIAYQATDEEILEYLQLVGPLKNSKEARNIQREKNSNKVFGYFQYVDAHSALSAIRNLNKRDFKGRELTIKYNEQDQQNQGNNNNQQNNNNNIGSNNQLLLQSTENQEVQDQRNKEKLDQIIEMETYIENLSKSEKIFILKELKSLVEKDRPFIASFLQDNPKMTKMILKLQTELNMNPYQTVQTNPQFNNLQAPNIVQNQIRSELRDQNLPPAPRYQQQQPPINQINNAPPPPPPQPQQNYYDIQPQQQQQPPPMTMQQQPPPPYDQDQQQQMAPQHGGFSYSQPIQQQQPPPQNMAPMNPNKNMYRNDNVIKRNSNNNNNMGRNNNIRNKYISKYD